MAIQLLILVVGLALIVFGADWLVDGASGIARKAGISEFVIGLTTVGMATFAPEMVVSLIGAFEGNADVAVGNVMGSNIFNILIDFDSFPHFAEKSFRIFLKTSSFKSYYLVSFDN